MPVIELLSESDWRSSPWPGGVSHELARWGESREGAWLARVSVAEIARSGPFTRYPGYRRWLAPLDDGGGLELVIDGVREQISAATAFSGDVEVAATLTRPARVWNLIAAANLSWTAEHVHDVVTRELPAGVVLIFAASERLGVELGSQQLGLPAKATLVSTSSQPVRLRVGASPGASAIVAHLGVTPAAAHGGERLVHLPRQLGVSIEGGELESTGGVDEVLARAFGIPQELAGGFDALVDCLSYVDVPEAGMTRVHTRPGGIIVVEVHDAERVAAPVFAYLVELIAFVNFRLRERGGNAVLTLSARR
ncbi:MAG: HutD family protein [Kofleriaceae bacterium]